MRTIQASQFNDPALNTMLWQWAAKQIWPDQEGSEFGPCCTMGVVDGGKLVAAVVYHNYDPASEVVELSAAATTPRWLARHVLREMFETVFVGLSCQMAVMRVSPKAKHLQRMLKSYGFSCYTIPRLRGRNEDELIFTLTDDAWKTNRFNMTIREMPHGQENAKAA